MTMASPWVDPTPTSVTLNTKTEEVDEAELARMYARSLIDHIDLGLAMAPRNRQRVVGASQIGFICARRLAYKYHDTPRVNFSDPMRSMVGTGVHAALADVFNRLNEVHHRWLVEYPITYRSIPGTLDLYDKRTQTVVDWKTTSKATLANYRKDGPPPHYIVQAQIYAAGLLTAGHMVRRVAIAFLPTDGTLEALYVWAAPADVRIADKAINRYEQLAGLPPSFVPATPSRFCGWCDQYQPSSTDLDLACPGATAAPQPTKEEDK